MPRREESRPDRSPLQDRGLISGGPIAQERGEEATGDGPAAGEIILLRWPRPVPADRPTRRSGRAGRDAVHDEDTGPAERPHGCASAESAPHCDWPDEDRAASTTRSGWAPAGHRGGRVGQRRLRGGARGRRRRARCDVGRWPCCSPDLPRYPERCSSGPSPHTRSAGSCCSRSGANPAAPRPGGSSHSSQPVWSSWLRWWPRWWRSSEWGTGAQPPPRGPPRCRAFIVRAPSGFGRPSLRISIGPVVSRSRCDHNDNRIG